MRETARRVAEIDLLACFAHLAALRGWARPQVDESGVLEFVDGRHPVVERRLEEQGGGRFVPNSLLSWIATTAAGPSLLLITGPNMGGKSTYLRQAALLVVHGAVRLLCAGGAHAAGSGGPHLHAHRGER